MKKKILFILLTILSLPLFSQIEKGNLIISLEGNYSKNVSEHGFPYDEYQVESKQLNIGPAIGYMITDKLYIGAGVDYVWSKESRYGLTYFLDAVQSQRFNVNSKGFMPNIFGGYYILIINKLYFNPHLKLSYGKINTDFEFYSATRTNFSTNYVTYNNLQFGNMQNNFSSISDEYDYELMNASLSPEISFFVTQRFCLNLTMGGIEYAIIDWETDNSLWSVNFNPANWRFGIKIRL